ncbi:MAG: DUF4070 domain-containing protein [Patescibacteria group bacterium]
MKILLLYPRCPDTFWSFRHALKFIGKKASFPPLGLLTVAALLPKEWEKKLIDMNVQRLEDKDLRWADYLFISAMIVQKESVREVIKKAKEIGVKIVAGGPLFTTGYEKFLDGIDHFILNESEVTFPQFLKDLLAGTPQKVYKSNEFPEVTKSPLPLFELADFKKYSSLSIQYSRGCPFNCEFCDIVIMNGRVPRTKDKEQIIRELEKLYNLGWRGGIFFVDDNFIGNKEKIKKEILPALIKWMKKKRYPFSFITEASINLADDEDLMNLMVEAGFNTVFVGIETPNDSSLTECGKFQNKNRNLITSVKTIQRHGLQVQGGFIVGFDSDTPSIFEKQIQFIQRSGIVTAMVGILTALPKTRLYQRLKSSNRLIQNPTGDNTDSSINFVTKMDQKTLLDGYKRIVGTIYSPKYYYERVKTFLKEYNYPQGIRRIKFDFSHLSAFFKSIWELGVLKKGRVYYWRTFFWCLFRRPQHFPLLISFSINGFHFRKVFNIGM